MLPLLPLALLAGALLPLVAGEESKQPMNLLFIMFDDMRPELSIYGRDYMVTPNFERLAKRSVVFDYAFCQIAVCNPSRDSLMTGLRPDSVGTYNFGHSYWPHLTLPMQLVRSGYNTVGIGKMYHWETSDKQHWSFDSWDNKWYDYQNEEWGFMNSSTMPDKVRPEEKFRDYEFTMRALKTWDRLLQSQKPYMLALGYKLPHLTLHVPHKYYELYKHQADRWKLGKRELRFPPTASEISYRCCADGEFKFMREEGAMRYNRSVRIGDINMVLPNAMHDELMMSYLAGISFLDTLLGKLLDFMDKHDLWKNTTVVLSADHGMHNGEKGIWEKWTLFEEATRYVITYVFSIFHANCRLTECRCSSRIRALQTRASGINTPWNLWMSMPH
jgi:iduronate 2-sulfatase